MVVQALNTSKYREVFNLFGPDTNSNRIMQLKILIKKGWIGAAKINSIGKSKYPFNDETLIPPYSVFSVKNVEGGFIELEFDPDSKAQDLPISCVA